MSTDFFARGMDQLRQATALDNERKFAEAYSLYKASLETLGVADKYEKDPHRKAIIQAKRREMLKRAEDIGKYLDDERDATNGGGGGSGATSQKAATADKKSKEDEQDKQRMRGALEGAIVKIKPNVKWDSIAGLEGAKEALKEAVILPVRFPQLFVGNRKPWKGILMYGPPGTGKSYLAKAVATEAEGTFLSVSSADLMSRWLGDSEKLVRNMFEIAREAYKESGKPTIIFIDEIDSLASARSDGENDATRRIKTEFLVQMQGVGNSDEGVLVLAATNIPWNLDSAIRRRFERRIYIPLPDAPSRAQMFKIHIGDTPHELVDSDWQELSTMTEYYSGSDINVLVRNAMMECIRTLQVATHFKNVEGPDPDDPTKRCLKRLVPCPPADRGAIPMTLSEIKEPKMVMPLPVTKFDFLKALRTARPSVNQADIDDHLKFTSEFGQEG